MCVSAGRLCVCLNVGGLMIVQCVCVCVCILWDLRRWHRAGEQGGGVRGVREVGVELHDHFLIDYSKLHGCVPGLHMCVCSRLCVCMCGAVLCIVYV